MTGAAPGFAFPPLTPAVKALLLVNAAVFVVNMIVWPATDGALVRWLGVSWDGLWQWFGLGLYRLVTYQFVHSFHDPFHLLGNMLVLYFFGTMVESAIGGTRLTRLYLVAGICGGLLQATFQAVVGSPQSLCVGASGACYGIMVFAAMLRPHAVVWLIVFPIKLWVLASVLVALGVYAMYAELVGAAGSSVAHGGHVGGAIWGFASYRIAYSGWRWVGRWRRWRQARTARAEHRRQVVMDRILEKVHAQGLGSLTPAERRFLQKASQTLQRR
jgi:membrane associated rhomboid family serine protease